MSTAVSTCAKKNLGSPDVTRECGHGKVEYVSLEDAMLTRVTLEPGWKWSESIRPTVHTESCQAHHLQYVIRGHLKVAMDDGSEIDMEPGDFASIPPGHDAWVVGNEPFVAIDLSPDMRQYAQGGEECHHE